MEHFFFFFCVCWVLLNALCFLLCSVWYCDRLNVVERAYCVAVRYFNPLRTGDS